MTTEQEAEKRGAPASSGPPGLVAPLLGADGGLASALSAYRSHVLNDDLELPRQYAELIAAVVSLTLRNDRGCENHLKNAKAAGATGRMIKEVLAVTLFAGGPPVLACVDSDVAERIAELFVSP